MEDGQLGDAGRACRGPSSAQTCGASPPASASTSAGAWGSVEVRTRAEESGQVRLLLGGRNHCRGRHAWQRPSLADGPSCCCGVVDLPTPRHRLSCAGEFFRPWTDGIDGWTGKMGWDAAHGLDGGRGGQLFPRQVPISGPHAADAQARCAGWSRGAPQKLAVAQGTGRVLVLHLGANSRVRRRYMH